MFKLFRSGPVETKTTKRNTAEILGKKGEYKLVNIMFDNPDIVLLHNTEKAFRQNRLSEISPSHYHNVIQISLSSTEVVLRLTDKDQHHFLKLTFESNPPNIKVGTHTDEIKISKNNKPIKTVELTSFILTLNDTPLTDYIKNHEELACLPGAIKFLEFCSKYPTERVSFEKGSQNEPDSAMALRK